LNNHRLSLQFDETSDFIGPGHLIAYVRYGKGTTFNEDILFCKAVKRKASAKKKNSLKLLVVSSKKKSMKWSECVGISTDAARIMTEMKNDCWP
jgi:hypothetical protein